MAGQPVCRNLLAWTWTGDGGSDQHVIVINLSAQPAQGRVPLDWPDLPGRNWHLTDLLTEGVLEREGDELAGSGCSST